VVCVRSGIPQAILAAVFALLPLGSRLGVSPELLEHTAGIERSRLGNADRDRSVFGHPRGWFALPWKPPASLGGHHPLTLPPYPQALRALGAFQERFALEGGGWCGG
jgi:hypothetical protein